MNLNDGLDGDFTLTTTLAMPAAGKVLGSAEPNGNLAFLLYTETDSKLVFDVVVPKLESTLAGAATSHSLSRSFDFSATRCP